MTMEKVLVNAAGIINGVLFTYVNNWLIPNQFTLDFHRDTYNLVANKTQKILLAHISDLENCM